MLPVLALAIVSGIGFSTVQPAEAGRGGRLAAGIALGIIAGAVITHQNRRHYRNRHDYYGDDNYSDYSYVGAGVCYKGPRRCRRVRRICTDGYGDRYRCGWRRKCWRPTYCD